MAKSGARRRTQVTGLAKAPTGIAGLDEITGGGLPRGRTGLVCGGPGTGKTLLGVEFLVRGARDLGEPGVFMSFEETTDELKQNVVSLGFDVDGLARAGVVSLDHVQVQRSEIEEIGEYDLEGLFVRLGYAIDSIGAKRVVLDTLEALFSSLSNEFILRAEIRRLFRWLNDRGLTTVVTAERGEGRLTRYGLEEYVSDFVLLLDNRIERQLATRRARIVKYRTLASTAWCSAPRGSRPRRADASSRSAATRNSPAAGASWRPGGRPWRRRSPRCAPSWRQKSPRSSVGRARSASVPQRRRRTARRSMRAAGPATRRRGSAPSGAPIC